MEIHVKYGEMHEKVADAVRRKSCMRPISLSEVPRELKEIVEAFAINEDRGDPRDTPPVWFDRELFLVGQKCGRDNEFSIRFCEYLSLFVMFTVQEGLDALIATGKSDAPFLAFERYLSTMARVKTWYEQDPFNPKSDAHKNLKTVRKKHDMVRKMMAQASPEELAVLRTVGKDRQEPEAKKLWSNLLELLQEDLKSLQGPALTVRVPPLSQGTMAVTQFSFFGLFALRPDLFGAHHVTERSLEGFVHVWAVLGYCLGIEDRHNFCLGGLSVARRRTEHVLQLMLRPQLLMVGKEWEHMGRCVSAGLRMMWGAIPPYEVALCYLVQDVLGEPAPRLQQTLSWRNWLWLQSLRLSLQRVAKFVPSFIPAVDAKMKQALDLAYNYPPQKIQELKARVYY